MSNNLYKLTRAKARAVCTRPAVRGLLYDYVTDLLEDPEATVFEEHLLDCLSCREAYLELLSLRGGSDAPLAADDGGEHEAVAADVHSFAGFGEQ